MIFLESKALVHFRIYDSIECRNSNPLNNIVWTKNDQMLVLDDEVITDKNLYVASGRNLLRFNDISNQTNGVYKCYSRDSGHLLSIWDASLKGIKVLKSNTGGVGFCYT